MVDKTQEFPTDPALFANRPLTPTLIEELLSLGPCQPGLNDSRNFPRNKQGRAFRREWYSPGLKNGMKSYREWLVYSPGNDSVYCFPCLLFANRGGKDYSPTFVETGFRNWKKATDVLSTHEHTGIHCEAVTVMLQTKQRLTLGKSVNAEQIRAR